MTGVLSMSDDDEIREAMLRVHDVAEKVKLFGEGQTFFRGEIKELKELAADTNKAVNEAVTAIMQTENNSAVRAITADHRADLIEASQEAHETRDDERFKLFYRILGWGGGIATFVFGLIVFAAQHVKK